MLVLKNPPKVAVSLPEEGLGSDEAVSDSLRAGISSGQLRPGEKLPEELLAEQYGTTRARIRTALQRLAFEDLVELRRNRGAYVAAPDERETRDIFAARQVIERATTEIVTRVVTTAQIEAIKSLLDEREREWTMGNRQVAIDSIGQFHRALAKLAHNEALSIALERLILRTSLILGLYGTSQGLASGPERYARLMSVIESGDSAAAAAEMDLCLYRMQRDLRFKQT